MPDCNDPNRLLINPLTGQPVLTAEEVAEVTKILEERKADPKKKAAALAAIEKQRRADEWVALLLDTGYNWNPHKKGELVHPDDPEKNAWRDPYMDDIFFSPKLKEELAVLARKVKGRGSVAPER